MATAREENNPYEGLGAGGKFRKKPYRRAQATPYDRPPTAIRNPSLRGGSAAGNGWLRKIVDPAQRLLASTAHRLFASVFTKRLTQPPPPQPPEVKQEAVEKQKAAISVDVPEEQRADFIRGQYPNSSSGEGCFKDLEEILKQKTFTTSEIDHLMALLRERMDDKPVEKEQKLSDVSPSKPVLFHEGKDEVAAMVVQDNVTESCLISTKPANLNVLDEDVASPAELAKAYMGSRPSKVSPSVLGLRSQAIAEDSTILSNLPHPSKSPILSIVPRSSRHVAARENGYMTPRARGRSAIYSMARTPYSRVHLTATPKSSGSLARDLGGPSPSNQAWDRSSFSGSKALKRGSSIFENDLGSAGPIRRIRQKPNLSYQKNWNLPVPGAVAAFDNDQQPSTSTQKMRSVSERKHIFAEESRRLEGDVVPGKNIPPVSSKSSEMASKILQQLDKIVSPSKERPSELKLAAAREMVPAKISPSKLQGQARKSLEHIDSSKFLEFGRGSNPRDNLVGTSQHDSRDATSEKKDKDDQNGLLNFISGSGKLSPSVNGLDGTVLSQRDSALSVRTSSSNLTNSLVHPPMQMKRSFKMSAHEDYLDMDDDGYCNGVASPTLVEGREKQDTSVADHKERAAQGEEKPSSISDGKALSSVMKEVTDQGVNERQAVPEKRVDFRLPSVAASNNTHTDLLASQSASPVDKSVSAKESNSVPPVFSFGDKVTSLKDQDIHTSPFGFAPSNGSLTSDAIKDNFKFGGSVGSAASLDSKSTNSSRFALADAGLVSFGSKVPKSEKVDDKGASKDEVSRGAQEPAPSSSITVSTSTPTNFTFGIAATNLTNGSVVSAPITLDSTTQKPVSSSFVPVTFGGNSMGSSQSSTIAAAAPCLPTSHAASSFPVGPIFKFGSSQVPSPSAVPPAESSAKVDSSSANINAIASVGSAPGGSSATSTIFGFGSANAVALKPDSASTGAANGSTQVPESPGNIGVAAFTQSVPVQFGSSAAASSGLSSASTTPSSSSLFGSASAANLFSSGAPFGSSSLSSSQASSASTTTSGLFGSTTPVFSSSFSTGFSFGASSASIGSSTIVGSAGSTPVSAPSLFGSTGTSASTGIFQFGSAGSSSGATGTFKFGSSGTSSASSGASPFGTVGSLSASTGGSLFGSTGTSSASTGSSIFGLTGASSGSTFSFQSAASAASSGAPFSFTAAAGASSSPSFSFTAAPANASSQPSFGNSSSVFGFGSPAPPNGNDQMNMEDTMAEDTVQASAATPPMPVFGQSASPAPASAPAPGFMFGSGAPGGSPFQFGTPQNLSTPPSASPFQASGSLDFNAGGSFSLGTGGGDKSGRKIVKVKHKQRRK